MRNNYESKVAGLVGLCVSLLLVRPAVAGVVDGVSRGVDLKNLTWTSGVNVSAEPDYQIKNSDLILQFINFADAEVIDPACAGRMAILGEIKFVCGFAYPQRPFLDAQEFFYDEVELYLENFNPPGATYAEPMTWYEACLSLRGMLDYFEGDRGKEVYIEKAWWVKRVEETGSGRKKKRVEKLIGNGKLVKKDQKPGSKRGLESAVEQGASEGGVDVETTVVPEKERRRRRGAALEKRDGEVGGDVDGQVPHWTEAEVCGNVDVLALVAKTYPNAVNGTTSENGTDSADLVFY